CWSLGEVIWQSHTCALGFQQDKEELPSQSLNPDDCCYLQLLDTRINHAFPALTLLRNDTPPDIHVNGTYVCADFGPKGNVYDSCVQIFDLRFASTHCRSRALMSETLTFFFRPQLLPPYLFHSKLVDEKRLMLSVLDIFSGKTYK